MQHNLSYRGGCQISDRWQFDGLRTIVLENELLRIVVLVDKGTDIVEFRYKPRDMDFLLQLPGGVRNPRKDTPSIGSGHAFEDYYSGGWNEILPNGGVPSTYKGAEFGQHGEISLVPWDYAIQEMTPERVSVKLWVRATRTPFYVEKTLTLESGKAALQIQETVTNEGGHPVHFMWGHHIAFGRPFLDEGAVIDTAECKFLVHEAMPGYEPRRFTPGASGTLTDIDGEDASRIPAYGETQAQEMAYLTDLRDSWYAITNQQRDVGFGVRFDPDVFRYVWYWQQLGNVAQGYPWWGYTHCAALEPWSSFPTNGLPGAVENGTALYLEAGQSLSTSLMAVAYHGIQRVQRITESGGVTPKS